jgi:hypothetical protein
MVNHPNRYGPPKTERDAIRRAYLAFRFGAGLQEADVARLFESSGLSLSRNRLRELGRDSDRALPITAFELWALISAWHTEIRK